MESNVLTQEERKLKCEWIAAQSLLEEYTTNDWSIKSYNKFTNMGYSQNDKGECRLSWETWKRYYTENKEEVISRLKGSEYKDIDGSVVQFRDPKEDLSSECLQMIASRQEEHATEEIVKAIKAENHIYTTRDDLKSEIWVYDGGIYKPNGESYIKEFVRSVLKQAYTPQRANKVIAKIEADTMIDSDKFFNTMYLDEIIVNNGILNLKTRTLKPFTPKKIFFNKLPVTYNELAKCPNVDKFFSEILKNPEDKKILYELVGYCLYKDGFLEKVFMFLGKGSNGKTLTLRLIKELLGVENTCSVRLNQMDSNNSALCELHNRLVNLAGDLDNTALKDTGVFKELTGRDSVQVKRKYLRDLIFTNYSKMVFACNELPKVYDLSEGFWRRWILLEFPYQFLPQKEIDLKPDKDKALCKLQDPSMIEKITTQEELSGLLNMALDGLKTIKKNKEFSYSTGTAAVKDMWIRKSDSFTAYCIDNLEEDPEGYVSKKDVRQSFVKYCKTHKVKGTSDINMKIVLENMFGVFPGRRGSSYENQEAVWEGIVFKSNSKGRDTIPTTLRNKIPYTSPNTLPTLTIDKKDKDLEVIPNNTKTINKTPKYRVLADIPNFVDPFNPKQINDYKQWQEIELNELVASILLKDGRIELIQ